MLPTTAQSAAVRQRRHRLHFVDRQAAATTGLVAVELGPGDKNASLD
jgi:hypothetical protein